jgi:hypothetical protein
MIDNPTNAKQIHHHERSDLPDPCGSGEAGWFEGTRFTDKQNNGRDSTGA